MLRYTSVLCLLRLYQCLVSSSVIPVSCVFFGYTSVLCLLRLYQCLVSSSVIPVSCVFFSYTSILCLFRLYQCLVSSSVIPVSCVFFSYTSVLCLLQLYQCLVSFSVISSLHQNKKQFWRCILKIRCCMHWATITVLLTHWIRYVVKIKVHSSQFQDVLNPFVFIRCW